MQLLNFIIQTEKLRSLYRLYRPYINILMIVLIYLGIKKKKSPVCVQTKTLLTLSNITTLLKLPYVTSHK